MYPYIAPHMYNLPWFLFRKAMAFIQLFVDNPGHFFSAPLWIGEFGTASQDTENWQRVIRVLEENDLDFAYWTLDGYKYPPTEEEAQRREIFGLLEDDYQTVKVEWKLKQLQRLMPILKGSTSIGQVGQIGQIGQVGPIGPVGQAGKALFYPVQLLYRLLSMTTFEKLSWLPWTMGSILEKNVL